MAVSKFRFRFQKAGDLRFLSHHDLMRVFERMLRRAELPFRSTEGFHPKPKMAFASALALGIVGHQEVIEIEFDGELGGEDVRLRLHAQAPAGLAFLSVCTIEPRVKAQAQRAVYQVRLRPELLAGLPARLPELLQQAECWVERSKPQPRRLNIRPYLDRLEIEGDALTMTFKVTPTGTARPEDVLRLLGLEQELMNGAVLERTALEIADESPSPLPAEASPVHRMEPEVSWSGGDEPAADTELEEPALPAADDRS